MSNHWWRRKKRFQHGFRESLADASQMEKMIDGLIRQVFRSPAEREKARRHYTCQFGGSETQYYAASQCREKLEPLVDVFLRSDSVVVIAGLLGIAKDDINVNATEGKVTIMVDSYKSRYYKELVLPVKINPKSSAASYKNGVLELRLSKTRQ